ncbi:MAG: hydroxymethylbilane synthase [Gammaproteobacteria bacterium]
MISSHLRIVTRKSPLALWQARFVQSRLGALHPDLSVELVAVHTSGDKLLDAPLATVGGKGLFVKELEERLLCGAADLAVHSMKDVTVDLPQGLVIPVVLAREDPRDAFVSQQHGDLQSLPRSALVGTSSLRRQCQLRAMRPDLKLQSLRGNVGTRLRKLDQGRLDAIILAAAGLKRLGLAARIRAYLDPDLLLPAIGQGAIGIECRQGDEDLIQLITPLDDPRSGVCVRAERALNRRLFGGCQLPIAGHAEILQGELRLRALVGSVDGTRILRDAICGAPEQAEELGTRLAEKLLAQGADVILAELQRAPP